MLAAGAGLAADRGGAGLPAGRLRWRRRRDHDHRDRRAPATTTPTPEARRAAAQRRAPVGDGEGGVRARADRRVRPARSTSPSRARATTAPLRRRAVRADPAGAAPTAASAATFLDLSDLVTCGGEQGLLSVAFAPDYERSGLLYVDYTDTDGDPRSVEYRRSAADPAVADPDSARELLTIERLRLQPQRRPAPVRTRRRALPRHRATAAAAAIPSARPGPDEPARQAAANRSRAPGGLRGRGPRPAQPVALLVRPRHRRPLDRRRRPGRARGDRRGDARIS